MLLHFPGAVRPAVAALWTIDEAMGAVVAEASQPALAAIKLAWWREALERLDHAPPPVEPRLQGAARELLSRGVSGTELAGIEPGWAALLDEQPDPAVVAEHGRTLFAIEAQLLGSDPAAVADAGRLFALADARRRGVQGLSDAITELRRELASFRSPPRLRPVTLATRLALRPPTEAEGTPARALALIVHRLTGRIV
ncbi:MAG: hypothetical protein ABR588_11985 [Sphingomicrobium sp.]